MNNTDRQRKHKKKRKKEKRKRLEIFPQPLIKNHQSIKDHAKNLEEKET